MKPMDWASEPENDVVSGEREMKYFETMNFNVTQSRKKIEAANLLVSFLKSFICVSSFRADAFSSEKFDNSEGSNESDVDLLESKNRLKYCFLKFS